jgi:hypothetical protein
MRGSHSVNAAVRDEIYISKCYVMKENSKLTKILKQLFRSMMVSRQASAAAKNLLYLTDSHLEEISFGRNTSVEGIKAMIESELDAAYAEKTQAVSANPNLVGDV